MLVRQKAKDISSLLMDDARLREERQSRGQMRDRMAGVGDYFNETMGYGRGGPGGGGPSTGSYYGSPYSRTPGRMNNNNNDPDDPELQRAIEESRRLAQNEKKNQEQR